MNGIIGPCVNIMIFSGLVPQKSKITILVPMLINKTNRTLYIKPKPNLNPTPKTQAHPTFSLGPKLPQPTHPYIKNGL